MKVTNRIRSSVSAVIFLAAAVLACGAQDRQTPPSWDGSRAAPVHLIPLKDEFDQAIIPSESYPMPFSSRYTCSPCHDYSVIAQGLHFNPASAEASGRVGEPWFWVDDRTGTVLPVSLGAGKGIWNPQTLGLSSWDMTLLFGRHMTGGGVGEVPMESVSPVSRWEVSGRLEINCMGCHNAARIQSHSEWAKQVLRQNFRWAATAASGLGEVPGMASRLPGTWDIFDGPNPDDTEWAVVPTVRYNDHLFDSRHRVFFDIGEKVEDGRCLVCHSVTPPDLPRYRVADDIHTAAGLRCVDCHHNDIRHAMVRGYEGEATDYGDENIKAFSCRGCHLGEDPRRVDPKSGGSLGAPYPRHKGIPAVHFEKLACTVCHSGPMPKADLTRVRTSRANRLGIYGKAHWYMDYPHIVEPVYLKVHGRLTPHRLMWPSFWGRFQGDGVVAVRPEDVAEKAGGLLTAAEDVARVLAAFSLSPDLQGTPYLLVGGRAFTPNADAKLDVSDDPLPPDPAGIRWVLKNEKEVLPLLPEFDPEAEEPDPDAELRVQQILEAFIGYSDPPGNQVLIYKNALYRLTEGYLDKVENPEAEKEHPWLGWQRGEELLPMVSEFQLRTILETAGKEQILTEEQVTAVLTVLNEATTQDQHEDNGDYFYIASGKLFRLDADGRLRDSPHILAEPVTWPLGHQVRPAQQSLGRGGCTDCHKEGSSFFFNKIEAYGPLLTEKGQERSAYSLMGLDGPYQKLFGLSFRVRPWFKLVLAVSLVIIGAVLSVVLALALGRVSGLLEKRR